MAESLAELEVRLRRVVEPGFGDRLLDKGLARGLIWSDGVLPEGGPRFPTSLTDDLLDYGHTVMAMALRLRRGRADHAVLARSFLTAGEAIEAAVNRGTASAANGFHKVSAAVAFHLAGYAARAYSIVPTGRVDDNLAPTERAVALLLRRRLDELAAFASSWLLDHERGDPSIEQSLRERDDFDETDAVDYALTTAIMRGLAWFDHALRTGRQASVVAARTRLVAAAAAAGTMHAIPHWWTATLAAHLIEELGRSAYMREFHYFRPTATSTRGGRISGGATSSGFGL